ncbi:hypothetical protein HMPREF1405_00424 [Helicobacter pylori GAM231Ai]|nr:hypothetical protein HMPREF1405_00424 [Helicobacter pylori GAM231Ai]
MAKANTLYLEISFLECKAVVLLKIFSFRGFLLDKSPLFKKEGFQ